MAQRKETKKSKEIKVRDLQPKKDAKGGYMRLGADHKQQGPGGHQITSPTGQK